MKKPKKPKVRSVVAKDLRTPKYRKRVEEKRKGKGSFNRREFGIRDMKENS